MLTDGRALRHRVEHAKGHPQVPLTEHELNDKFRYCTAEVLPPDAIEIVIEMFRSLPAIANTSRLFGMLAPQEAAA
jgi:2-methylcitrate dehydratase PrpD